MADQPFQPFQIVISGREIARLKAWGEWAGRAGVRDDFLRTLKTINFRLAYEPDEWGEPEYALNEMNLRMFFGSFLMLNVWYGISDEHRLVFVQEFEFCTTYPLAPPPDAS